MFIVSEKDSPTGLLIVVTDENILGKKFEEGKLQLDLTKEFYQGEKKNEEELKLIFQKAQHIHLTGENSVALGIKLNLIEQNHILRISGIPHAEVVMS